MGLEAVACDEGPYEGLGQPSDWGLEGTLREKVPP